eukprot:COSAG06_NODE_10539_length_1663_cov_2.017026_1_plen_71_part_00
MKVAAMLASAGVASAAKSGNMVTCPPRGPAPAWRSKGTKKIQMERVASSLLSQAPASRPHTTSDPRDACV